MRPSEIRSLLESEVQKRSRSDELSHARPDPLLVASRHNDETIALVCALFGYGNAKQIVAFLETLDFSLLHADEDTVQKALARKYYRFQKGEDIAALFIALRRLGMEVSIESVFYEGYRKAHSVLEGLRVLIAKLYALYPYESDGYRFLLGIPPPEKLSACGTYKRYMMYLRWMVRNEGVDLGLWRRVDKAHLLMPLDTHTFRVSRNLGLLKRKSCDMKAVMELTESLRRFDSTDPIKYDFALYRIGQEHISTKLL